MFAHAAVNCRRSCHHGGSVQFERTVTGCPLAPASSSASISRCTFKRLAPADHRLALLVERIEEIRDRGPVPVVRERHRVGAGAASAVFGFQLGDSPVVMRHDEIAADERSGRLLADDLDALRKARIGRGRRVDGADRAALVADARPRPDPRFPCGARLRSSHSRAPRRSGRQGSASGRACGCLA